MKINYVKTESSVKPELVNITSSSFIVYIRKNISEITKTFDNKKVTFYEYDEAKLTKEEYIEYIKELSTTDTLQTIENLKEENSNLNERLSMLTECLLEMSKTVYA